VDADVPLKDSGRRHGLTHHPCYTVWWNMMRRCADMENLRYGGRGIRVCERWHTVENFIADMGIPPAASTLERIHGDGNYEKSNCRWATVREQTNNRHTNRRLTFAGETLTVNAWAEKLGLHRRTITTRLDACGWSVEEALTTPKNGKYAKKGVQEVTV
jgi:hypothetical protein